MNSWVLVGSGGDVYLAISRDSWPRADIFTFYSFMSWLRDGNLNEKRKPEAICPSSTNARNSGPSFHPPQGQRVGQVIQPRKHPWLLLKSQSSPQTPWKMLREFSFKLKGVFYLLPFYYLVLVEQSITPSRSVPMCTPVG